MGLIIWRAWKWSCSLSPVWIFVTPWTVVYQAPPSMGFSRQEYWSGLQFPSPRDLPDQGIEPGSPAFQADALTSEPPGKPMKNLVQLSSASLCNPMDCTMPGFPVHYQLLELTQTHIHQVGDAFSSSVFPFSSHLWSFPESGSFPMSQFFASGGLSIGVSASASVLPMNIQDWFPLGWTCWISLQPKRLSKSSPTPQFKSINSSVLIFLYSPTVTSKHDYWKNHSFD